MVDQSANFNNSSDDLDLAALILKWYTFFKKYAWIIIGASVAGTVCGVVLYVSLPKVYSSKLFVESSLLSDDEEMQLIGNWDNLLNNDGYPLLAKHLDCDPQILRQLNHINTDPILKASPNSSAFIIEVLVKDTAVIEPLERAILYGLENSTYVSQKVQTKKANLLELIASTQVEIARMDSTKKNIDDILTDRKKSSSPLMVNISDMNTQMVALREKLLTYQENLKFVNDIQVLQDFVKTKRPKQPKLSILFVSGFGLGLLIGLCLALYRSFRAKYLPVPPRP
jgi:uncharacterized protein involved in exopolysaccharide biosynthesis